MDRVIQVSIRIDAPRARLWQAWTDPAHLSRWLPDRVEGAHVTGGRVTYYWDALNMGLELDVLEIIEGRRLVLRGEPAELAPQTQMVELSDDGDGTRVSVSHRGFTPDAAGEDIYHGTASGWHLGLQILKQYVEAHWGEARLNAWFLGMAPARFEQVFAMFSREGRARWLPRGAADRELARYLPRDVLLTCPAANGVLALRQFAVAPSVKLIGANLMSWNRSETEVEPLARSLAAAVDGLIASLGGASRPA